MLIILYQLSDAIRHYLMTNARHHTGIKGVVLSYITVLQKWREIWLVFSCTTHNQNTGKIRIKVNTCKNWTFQVNIWSRGVI